MATGKTDKDREVRDHFKFEGKLGWGMGRNIEGSGTLMFGLGMFRVNNGGAEMRVTVNAVNDLVVDAAHLPRCPVEGVTALWVPKVWRGVTRVRGSLSHLERFETRANTWWPSKNGLTRGCGRQRGPEEEVRVR